MSPSTREAKKQAKARHRRHLKAQERLARDRRQAQRAAEALHEAGVFSYHGSSQIWPQIRRNLHMLYLSQRRAQN
jgi:ABC-type nitrate/sulfonate/bicarbonate transport system substrate-binding protein